jgi:hypothetical protein
VCGFAEIAIAFLPFYRLKNDVTNNMLSILQDMCLLCVAIAVSGN